jgi:hypothetical protein
LVGEDDEEEKTESKGNADFEIEGDDEEEKAGSEEARPFIRITTNILQLVKRLPHLEYI